MQTGCPCHDPIHQFAQVWVAPDHGVGLHHLGVAQERGHGCAQLVCREADEIGLCPVQPLQLVERPGQFLVDLAQLADGLLIGVPQPVGHSDEDTDAQRWAAAQDGQERVFADLQDGRGLGGADGGGADALLDDGHLAKDLAWLYAVQKVLGFVVQPLEYVHPSLDDDVDCVPRLSLLADSSAFWKEPHERRLGKFVQVLLCQAEQGRAQKLFDVQL